MNVKEISKIGKRLLLNYPSKKKEEIIDILNDWEGMLSKLNYETVNSNLDQHLLTSNYFPKLADLSKNHSFKTKSVIPDLEETEAYLKSLKELEKEAVGKDIAMKYIEQMKKGLGVND